MIECNQKELSRILGLSDRRVRQMAEDGLFERDPVTKKYNLPKCVQEFIRYKVELESTAPIAVNFETERAEHERVKKDIAKLKLRRYRGELHEASEIEAELSDMLIRFRGKILAIPTKLAPQLLGMTDPNTIVRILKNELRETLTELSGYNPVVKEPLREEIDDEGEDSESDSADL
jgi:phage terminase Nu1 subunit (DNA packaging protein)